MKATGLLIKMSPKEEELEKLKLHTEIDKYPKNMTR